MSEPSMSGRVLSRAVELELGAAVLASFAELTRRHDDAPGRIRFGADLLGLEVEFLEGDLVSTYMLDGAGVIHVPNPDASQAAEAPPDWVPEDTLGRRSG